MADTVVGDGQVSTGAVLNDGDRQVVQSQTFNAYTGGRAYNTVINNGATQFLMYGAAFDATVNAGGSQLIGGTGTATGTILNGGYQFVDASADRYGAEQQNPHLTYGQAVGTTINAGGIQRVGAFASNTTINDGGVQVVALTGDAYFADGAVDNTTINSGGVQFISSGTTRNTHLNAGGAIEVNKADYGSMAGAYFDLASKTLRIVDGHAETDVRLAGDYSNTQFRVSEVPGTAAFVIGVKVTAQAFQAPINGFGFSGLSDADAASFRGDNSLYFASNVRGPGVSVSSTSLGVVVTAGGTAKVFSEAALATASQAQLVLFTDGSHLLTGTNAGSDVIAHSDATNYYVFALGGNDTLTFGDGENNLNGGAGDDIIQAGNGNNHIWGGASTSVQGDIDGNDTITAGLGTNYINGNAGDDVISAGTPFSAGINRLFGGAGRDTITILGDGYARANGNMGDDAIDASTSTGSFLLRGGKGNDVIHAGRGQGQLMGDLGSDTLVAASGSGHLAVMTGGADADLFDFSLGAQTPVKLDATTYYQEVTDFVPGDDHIGLAFAVSLGNLVKSSATSSDVAAAQASAQQALAARGDYTGVAAVQVGHDTYLFYDAQGTSAAIDSVVRLDGVTTAMLTSSDFVRATH